MKKLSKTPSNYQNNEKSIDQGFKCKHCHRFVGPLPSGGHYSNRCTFCLYSLHVDGQRSEDRLSDCRPFMEPAGAFQRSNGEHVLVYRCQGCGFERFNRIATDDDFDLVLALPVLPSRSAKEVKNQALQSQEAYTPLQEIMD